MPSTVTTAIRPMTAPRQYQRGRFASHMVAMDTAAHISQVRIVPVPRSCIAIRNSRSASVRVTCGPV